RPVLPVLEQEGEPSVAGDGRQHEPDVAGHVLDRRRAGELVDAVEGEAGARDAEQDGERRVPEDRGDCEDEDDDAVREQEQAERLLVSPGPRPRPITPSVAQVPAKTPSVVPPAVSRARKARTAVTASIGATKT